MLGEIQAFLNSLPAGVTGTAQPRSQGDYLITLTQGQRELRIGHVPGGIDYRLVQKLPLGSNVLSIQRNLREFLPYIETWAAQ